MVDRRTNEDGRAGLVLLVLVVLILIVPGGCAAIRMLDRTAPTVTLKSEAKAIGKSARVTVEADEPKWGVRELRATFVQGGVEVPLGEVTQPHNSILRFWRKREIKPSVLLEVEVGRDRIPEMKEGPAVIRAESTSDSWARFGKGRTTVQEISLPVVLTPPRVETVSSQHYINQGGSECVSYRVSETAIESGVRVGNALFRGYPLPGGGPGDRFCIFAYPYNEPTTTVPVVYARDAAGNEATATFLYKLFPKKFPDQKLPVTDDFLRRVVPAILAESPQVTSENDLVKDFLQINGRLRRLDAAYLVELSAQSRPQRLWNGAFTQLGNSKVEAAFADHRAYVYGDRVIDHQDHLGFDLAVTANHPIEAANDGVVMLAKYFGIYGNTVVLDHGYGLMTLYAHLSSIDVKQGDAVKRGQTVGKSGATGLAGGDHLHFSVLVQGVPVNPIEWWDAHWIHDRIESKLTPGGDQPGAETETASAAAHPAPSRRSTHGRRRHSSR
jgi:murein DD-endopeptidase MepM/ murein hydrolase activator NlpD